MCLGIRKIEEKKRNEISWRSIAGAISHGFADIIAVYIEPKAETRAKRDVLVYIYIIITYEYIHTDDLNPPPTL